MKVSKPNKIQEPSWTNEICSQYQIIDSLNWYNQNKTEKDARKYLVDCLKKDKACPILPSTAESFDNNQFVSLGFLSRMIANGAVLPEKSKQNYDDSYKRFIERVQAHNEVKASKPKAEVVNMQERVQAKADSFIGDLEGLVDLYGIRGDSSKMNAYQWMVDNEVKSVHASKIAEFFGQRAATLEANFKNPELKEYYEGYEKKRFLNLFKCYAMIAVDAGKLANNQKAQRKPRVKKAVSAEKKVAGVKYCSADTNFKLSSIDPVNILGASQLWTFNIKSRKLTVYHASDSAGLMVKGSTIENYTTKDSVSKTLRKPEKTLTEVLNGGKISLRKIMSGINAKSAEPNGRINKDTILLKAIK